MPPSHLSPATRLLDEALARETDAALAKRSIAGVFAYLGLLVILLAVTSLPRTFPGTAALASVWMVGVGLARLRIARASSASPVWRRSFRVATTIAGASWGVGAATWMHAAGWTSDAVIVLVTTAGISAGAITSLSPDVKLLRAYLVTILGPTIFVALALSGGSRVALGFSLVVSMYLGFLCVEGKHLHDAFTTGIVKTNALADAARSLTDRNASLKRVLDTVGQGFLHVSLDGAVAEERSAIVETWLGPSEPGEPLWAFFGRSSPRVGLMLQMGWSALAEDLLPLELTLDQLPGRLECGGCVLDLAYRPIDPGSVARGLLVVLTDATAIVAREKASEERTELLSVFEHVLRDRTGFVVFLDEVEQLLAAIQKGLPPDEERRAVHTLKGNCAMFGLRRFARACDALESRWADADDPLATSERDALGRSWNETSQQLRALLGTNPARVDVAERDYRTLIDAIGEARPHAELAALVSGWTLEPTVARLERAARYAEQLGERLGKPRIRVMVEANDLRLSAERWSPFWGSFVHLVRNAVDHGVESAEERRARGKPPEACLFVRTALDADEFVVSVEDDGPGIDWETVRARARGRGLPADGDADLLAALFSDGLSTRPEASETSGRGVGLAAVLASVRPLGGRCSVTSRPGQGSCCTVRFPRSSMRAAA